MKCLTLAILFAGLACSSPAAAAGGQDEELPRLDPPLVIDADGKIVGRYVYSAGSSILPAALFDDDGTLTVLDLTNIWRSSYLTFHNTGNLSHTTADCSGATYIASLAVGVRPGAVIFHDDGTFSFYLADRSRAEPPTRIRSIGTPADCVQTDEVLDGQYETSSPPLDLTARFRLPLHLR
jgi:hypothetical protein